MNATALEVARPVSLQEEESWGEAYGQSVSEIRPLVAGGIAEVLSPTPTIIAKTLQHDIAQVIAVGLIEQRIKDSYVDRSGLNTLDATPGSRMGFSALDDIVREKILAFGIDSETLLNQASQHWEQLLQLRNRRLNTLPLQVQGSVSEGGVMALLGIAEMTRRQNMSNTNSEDIERLVNDTVNAGALGFEAQYSFNLLAAKLESYLFKSPEGAIRVKQLADSDDAKDIIKITQSRGVRMGQALLGSEATIFINGAQTNALGSLKLEVSEIFQAYNEAETWNRLTKEKQTSLAFLVAHSGARLGEKVRLIFEDPQLLQALYDLPDSIKGQFVAWQDAAFTAGAISESSLLHADMTVGPVRSVGRRVSQGVNNFFAPSQDPERPNRPGASPFAKVVLGLTITSILAASCGLAPQTQLPPPGHSTGLPPSPVPVFTPLPPDVPTVAFTPTPFASIGTPYPEYWKTSDFPVVAQVISADSARTQGLLPAEYTRVEQDLVFIEQSDPRCAGLTCEAYVALSSNRVQYFMRAQDGALYVAVVERNTDGSYARINKEMSEWVPVLTTYKGEVLRPVWFFDFNFDAQGNPIAVGGDAAISRLGFDDKDGHVLALWTSPFGDQITQILVKDSLRLMGPEFPPVDGREFVISVDAGGKISAGYFKYDVNGKILDTVAPIDAKGTRGMYKYENNTWVFVSEAAPPTATPPATATAEMSPTPDNQLGGNEVAIMYNSFGVRLPDAQLFSLIKQFTSMPTTPEAWAQIQGIPISDGTTLQWGAEFTYTGSNGTSYVGFPVLVRGSVTVDDPAVKNGKLIISVMEKPAKSGSNFLVSVYQDNTSGRNPSMVTFDLKNTLPIEIFHALKDGDELLLPVSKAHGVTEAEMARAIDAHVGEMVVVIHGIGGNSDSDLATTAAFDKLLNDTLITGDGGSLDVSVQVAEVVFPKNLPR